MNVLRRNNNIMFLQHHQNDIAGNLCQGEKIF